jgi:hypothetical protein
MTSSRPKGPHARVDTDSVRTRLPLLFVLGAAMALGVVLARLPAITAVLIPAAFGFIAVMLLVRLFWPSSPDAGLREWVIRWALLALVSRLVVGIVITSSPHLTLFFGSDALTYQRGASQLAASWSSTLPAPDLPVTKEGFFFLLSALYSVLGVYALAGVAINAVMSAALVPIVTDTTDRLFGRQAARFVAPMLVLLPGFAVWTGQLLREASILFLLAVAANAVVRLTRRVTPWSMLAFGAACSLLFIFRGNVAIVATIGFLAGLAVARRSIASGLMVAAVAFGLVAILTGAFVSSASLRQLLDQANLRQVDTIRGSLSSSAGSAFSPGVSISTAGQAVRFLPLGLASLLLGPFPRASLSVRQLLGLLDAVVVWLLIPSLWRGLRLGWGQASRRLIVLLLPALTVSIVLALLLGNFGLVVRERLQVWVLLMPIVALGLSVRKRHRSAGDREYGVPRVRVPVQPVPALR